MTDWTKFASLLDFCVVYYTTQLVRCALFSFILIGFVMLLRKMLFSGWTFFRGMLWTLFLVIPFLGRLKLFYENEVVFRATWRITAVTTSWRWADRIYMAGILVTGICIFGKRLRFRRTVAGMEKVIFESICIYITDMNVTPFTVGLLKPKIVLPKVMVDSFSCDELMIVMKHEKTHIRLGHLWFGFAWDILRCLLWINPFLTIFLKAFRADLEDICDRVCIQNSKKTAYEYGLILLKSLKLLQFGQVDVPFAATYVGERDFADLKRRMKEIADFRPYRKGVCVCMAVVVAIAICTVLVMVHSYSYSRYSRDEDVLVYEFSSEGAELLDYNNSLHQMISYDDSYVYVDREAFERFLCRNNTEGEIFIVFGGFYKLPGFSSGGESCLYKTDTEDDVVRIPYEKRKDDWMVALYKLL